MCNNCVYCSYPESGLDDVFQVLPSMLVPSKAKSLDHEAINLKPRSPYVHLFQGLVGMKFPVVVNCDYIVSVTTSKVLLTCIFIFVPLTLDKRYIIPLHTR